MFTIAEVVDYEQDFNKLGITDVCEMQSVLNTLGELADIAYYIYKAENR